MGRKVFDFGILGDHHLEGLLVASALARKGYSVLIVRSETLGMMPTSEEWTSPIPEMIGNRRLDELLFKAGFFRLEDAGLIPIQPVKQFVLPKHRLSLDGSFENWSKEVRREFPLASSALEAAAQSHGNGTGRDTIGRLKELEQWQTVYPGLKLWLEGETFAALQRSQTRKSFSSQTWIHSFSQSGSKAYVVNPELDQPYAQFLLKHAKKWGAEIYEQEWNPKASWRGLELESGVRMKDIVLNGSGFSKSLPKKWLKDTTQDLKYWLYFDRIETEMSYIPEPLQSTCYLYSPDQPSDFPSLRKIMVERQPLYGEATITIGSWMPSRETTDWIHQVESGRKSLKQMIPFLPDSNFKSLPTLHDLSDAKGECIRRDEVDRMIFEGGAISKSFRWMPTWFKKSKERPRAVARHLYAVTPHYQDRRGHAASLLESLKLTEYFDKRRPEAS